MAEMSCDRLSQKGEGVAVLLAAGFHHRLVHVLARGEPPHVTRSIHVARAEQTYFARPAAGQALNLDHRPERFGQVHHRGVDHHIVDRRNGLGLPGVTPAAA